MMMFKAFFKSLKNFGNPVYNQWKILFLAGNFFFDLFSLKTPLKDVIIKCETFKEFSKNFNHQFFSFGISNLNYALAFSLNNSNLKGMKSNKILTKGFSQK